MPASRRTSDSEAAVLCGEHRVDAVAAPRLVFLLEAHKVYTEHLELVSSTGDAKDAHCDFNAKTVGPDPVC